MNKPLVALACVLGLAGCGGAPSTGGASTEPVPVVFQPTAFGVTVTGRGRPVILIPCLGCPGTIWNPTVGHLGASVQTHVLTLSGFAGRPPIDKPLIATARAELAVYIRDRQLDHPIVIGHSLGGFLVYWLAATEPDLVGPVVTVDAPPALIALPGALDYAAKQRDRWKQMSAADFDDAIRTFFAPMANDPADLAPLLRDIVHSDQRSIADAFYELFATDVRPDLPKIKVPLLAIIADTEDQQPIAAQLAPIAGHETVVLPRTKHMVMLDDAAAFYRAIDAFIAAHPAAHPAARPASSVR
ncbi:MAG: alpha/beta hydrolase [Myxococcales bacterium]|nr:alpha/beta hydrolase [Myxococcales bacterium]